MAIQLERQTFNQYLKELSKTYRIFAPVLKKGKGKFAETDLIGYGEISCLEEMVLDEKSYYSPKEILYPIRETLFYFKDGQAEAPSVDEKPALIFARPCDINGIRRLDTIFMKNGDEPDYYYAKRREKAKLIMLECTEGFDTCFCVSMNSNETQSYDGAVRIQSDAVYLKLESDSLENEITRNGKSVDFTPVFVQKNKVAVVIPPVEKVSKDTFNHPLWEEYTQRCIACGRCNTSCITCSCYTMQDLMLSDDQRISERRRVWAGCHVDGFTDMAGGHSFRKQNGERMRFKTMHKINDYYRRFQEHMCVGCGRCDDVCPEYISFAVCINKLNQIVEEGEVSE